MQTVHFQIFSLSSLSVYTLQLLCRTCKNAANFIIKQITRRKKIVNRMFARWYHRTFDSKISLHYIFENPQCHYIYNIVEEGSFGSIYPFSRFKKRLIFVYQISIFSNVKSKCVVEFSDKRICYLRCKKNIKDCIQCDNGYVFIIKINQYILLHGYKKYQFDLFHFLDIKNVFTKIIICANINDQFCVAKN